MKHVSTMVLLFLVPSLTLAQPNKREQKVRTDKAKVEAAGFWIYNDLEKGFAQARQSGKPIVVVLRCIPCEECVKLDDDLVDADPEIRPLLEKFVCVRIVSANGLDLSLFQFDTDQSWAVFMLNADKTIYGRFGTRSHRTNWVGDVSLKGLAKALAGALELHAQYPHNKQALAGKRGGPPEFASPELFPNLRTKYQSSLNYAGNVVQSCIHCHQIGDAQRELYRQNLKPIPETVLFPYPHPLSIGLTLDPTEKARVKLVQSNSWVAQSGFQEGDDIVSLNGQPLLSIADAQWVLHQTSPEGGAIAVDIRRNDNPKTLTLRLPNGWRQHGDISWRVSSWGLRRMVLGGMVLEHLPADVRPEMPPGGMALRVKSVGQFGPHAAARNAGVRQGDILTAYDGKTHFTSEGTLLAWSVNARKPGDSVKLRLLRNGKPLELTIPIQD